MIGLGSLSEAWLSLSGSGARHFFGLDMCVPARTIRI